MIKRSYILRIVAMFFFVLSMVAEGVSCKEPSTVTCTISLDSSASDYGGAGGGIDGVGGGIGGGDTSGGTVPCMITIRGFKASDFTFVTVVEDAAWRGPPPQSPSPQST